MKEIEKYIFIITYGRTGSTLLMKLLNQIEGACIRGENGGALYALFQSYQAAVMTRKQQGNSKSLSIDHPWYGAAEIRPKRYARALGRVFVREILQPPEGTRITGFKEIRYPSLSSESLEKFINFLHLAFKGEVYIIFNRRNLEDVSRSSWWSREDPKKVQKMLRPMYDWMEKYNARHPKRTFLAEYDQYVQDHSSLRYLFEFLGETYPEDELKQVFNTRLMHCKRPQEKSSPRAPGKKRERNQRKSSKSFSE